MTDVKCLAMTARQSKVCKKAQKNGTQIPKVSKKRSFEKQINNRDWFNSYLNEIGLIPFFQLRL
jgi:hypothetical protein